MGDSPAPDAVEGAWTRTHARENARIYARKYVRIDARYTMPERMSDRISEYIYIYAIYILSNGMSETMSKYCVRVGVIESKVISKGVPRLFLVYEFHGTWKQEPGEPPEQSYRNSVATWSPFPNSHHLWNPLVGG
jgi:hypothetical protein